MSRIIYAACALLCAGLSLAQPASISLGGSCVTAKCAHALVTSRRLRRSLLPSSSTTDYFANNKLTFPATAVPSVARFFNVSYQNTFKLVTDLRTTPAKVYVLVQARPGAAAARRHRRRPRNPPALTRRLAVRRSHAQPGRAGVCQPAVQRVDGGVLHGASCLALASRVPFLEADSRRGCAPTQIPVTSVASGDTTVLQYLELLGLYSSFSVLDMTYVTSPCLQKLAQCGAVTVASSASNPVTYGPGSAWLAATAGVQMVLTDSFGTAGTGTAKDVNVDASFDPGLLNRGEWVKFVSLFFNAEAAANALFAVDVTSVAALQAATSASLGASPPPVVAFTSFLPLQFRDAYYHGTSLETSNSPYKLQLVQYAGGTVLAQANASGGSTFVGTDLGGSNSDDFFASAASFRASLANVSVLIDESYAPLPQAYTFTTFLNNYGFTAADISSGAFPFLSHRRVFREDKALSLGAFGGVGINFDEAFIAEPVAAAADFQAAINPAASPPGFSTRWLRNIAAGEVPAVLRASQCAVPAVDALCGGATTYGAVQNVKVAPSATPGAAANATASSIAQAVISTLPVGATAAVFVEDWPVSFRLTLSSSPPNGSSTSASTTSASSTTPPLLPDGLDAFLGALSGLLTFPVSGSVASSSNASASSPAVAVLALTATSMGGNALGAAAAAELLATLANATALLPMIVSAATVGNNGTSASGVRSVSVTSASVAADLSIAVTGVAAAAASTSLAARIASGRLDAALAAAGVASPSLPSPPAASSGAARADLAPFQPAFAVAAAALVAAVVAGLL